MQGHQKTEYVWSLLSKSTQSSSFAHNCIPVTAIYVQRDLHWLYQYVGHATSTQWGATATLPPTPHAGMLCQGLSRGHSWSVNTTETSKCYKSGFLTPQHKSQCLKLPAHGSTALHYCSFRTLCESQNYFLLSRHAAAQFLFCFFKEKSITYPAHSTPSAWCFILSIKSSIPGLSLSVTHSSPLPQRRKRFLIW